MMPIPPRFFDLTMALDRIDEDGGGFERAIELAIERLTCGRVYFIGNGGSAAICSHMAADWTKTGGFSAMCFNDGALLTCLANDLGYSESFALPIRRFSESIDLLVAISSSGQSQNVINGVREAQRNGLEVITMSGFDPQNSLRKLGDVNFHVPSRRYGTIEIAHLAICHHILDCVVERTQDK